MEIHFLLFFAGLVGGTMNALAGGGSGVTFAALVVSGMPPIIANATNTFAATLGYITGALGYRNHLTAVRRDLDGDGTLETPPIEVPTQESAPVE